MASKLLGLAACFSLGLFFLFESVREPANVLLLFGGAVCTTLGVVVAFVTLRTMRHKRHVVAFAHRK
jgi:hypothetical protein